MDNVSDSYPKSTTQIILGDFNINMLQPQPSWESTFSLYGLQQVVTEPTRVTSKTATLLDHIYTNNKSKLADISLSDIGLSDHAPVKCSLLCDSIKVKKNGHTCVYSRSLKNFDKDMYLADLSN